MKKKEEEKEKSERKRGEEEKGEAQKVNNKIKNIYLLFYSIN